MTNRSRWIGVGVGAAIGLGAIAGVQVATDDAQAAPVKVTQSQLKINQRISQAAVKRSNEALTKIAALTAQVAALQAGAGAGSYSGPLWGASNGTSQESLITTRGGTGVTSIFSNQAGRYTVKMNRNIATCTYSATIAADSSADLTNGRDIRVAVDLSDAARTQLLVFTSKADGKPSNAPFHIQVFC